MLRGVRPSVAPSCLVFSSLLALCGCPAGGSGTAGSSSAREVEVPSSGIAACPTGPAVARDGVRQLALLVGVGDYAAEKIRDLKGPPNDVASMRKLITNPEGYGFPEANVCVLTGNKATKSAVLEAWDAALVARAQPGDSVLFYFAGHGSQAPDQNGDEPDEMDETLMFYDARTASRGEMLDDEMNGLLARLYQKTENVTVILDSCNAGTASRDVSEGVMERFVDPPDEPLDGPAGGDGGEGWRPESMPNLVLLSAARDGSSALEKKGRGVFTQSLVQVLASAEGAMTYAQVARKVPLSMAGVSRQIPEFRGALTRLALDSSAPRRPFGWEVTKVEGPRVELAGVPMPGFSAGTVLLLYAGSADASTLADPKQRIAAAVLETYEGFVATAKIQDQRRAPEPGDVAVLHVPGEESVKLNVVLVSGRSASALPPDTAAALRKEVAEDPQGAAVLRLDAPEDAFRVRLDLEGQPEIVGPEGAVRNTIESEAGDDLEAARRAQVSKIVENLILHARQKALLNLQPVGGGALQAQSSLSVRLVKTNAQSSCVKDSWPALESGEQVVPACGKWKVEVSLARDAPSSMFVGGLLFSSNGSMFGIPYKGPAERLQPGDSVVFPQAWQAGPPFGLVQRVRIFGTLERIPWREMTKVATRFVAEGGLGATLAQYMDGSRVTLPAPTEDPGPWTMSEVTYRAEANPGFGAPPAEGLTELAREYTIPAFDLTPYLPSDKESPFYRVLRKVKDLTDYHHEQDDGVPYKQHSWDRATDEANLAVGIDCSRSQWFVFDRAGLSYTEKRWQQGYMTTEMMADRSSGAPMRTHFEDCLAEKPRTGDLIVQRDPTRGDGHVVMVIDPDRRIAWGSHGWDGNKDTKDTGVEFQQIRYKKDWAKWDRATMRRVACWRHKAFIAAWDEPGGRPGSAPVQDYCGPARCPAR